MKTTRALLVPALAVVVLASGCSGSRHQAAPAGATSSTSASLAQVQTAMAGVRSYAFRLTATSRQASATAVLLAVGRVQAPRRILATVSESGRSEQVLGTEAGQFVAAANGKWSAVKGTSLQPIDWKGLLAGVAGTATGDRSVSAALTSAQARAVGFPAAARFGSGHYTLTLDGQHRVTLLQVSMQGTDAGAAVVVTETVRLSGFDSQPAIPVRPAV